MEFKRPYKVIKIFDDGKTKTLLIRPTNKTWWRLTNPMKLEEGEGLYLIIEGDTEISVGDVLELILQKKEK